MCGRLAAEIHFFPSRFGFAKPWESVSIDSSKAPKIRRQRLPAILPISRGGPLGRRLGCVGLVSVPITHMIDAESSHGSHEKYSESLFRQPLSIRLLLFPCYPFIVPAPLLCRHVGCQQEGMTQFF